MANEVVPLFFGKVVNGKIIPRDENSIRRWNIRVHSLEGKEVQYFVDLKKKKRSYKQNNYYWGAIIPIIAGETGYTEEETHEALKHKFLVVRGDKLDLVRSTAHLTTGEFTEFVMKIQQWGSEFLGIEQWPDPEEYYDKITELIDHGGETTENM